MKVQMPQWKGNFLGECLAHRKADDFGGCGKRVSCAKTDGPILTIYTSHDMFLRKELPLGSCNDCTCVKTFSGVNFFNLINSLTR